MRECITTVVFVFSAAACASVQQRLGERLGLKEGSLTQQCANEGLRIDLLGACTPLCLIWEWAHPLSAARNFVAFSTHFECLHVLFLFPFPPIRVTVSV